MVFPVVMYGCERWTIKKAEPWRTDAFELWYWRGLLRVQWTVKKIKSVNSKGNQFLILIERTDTEAPILWPLHVKSQLIRKDSCWERLNTEGEGGDRGWDGWMASLTQWTCVWASSRRWWRIEKPGMLQSVGSRRVGHDWATEQQQQQQQKCESYTKSISRHQMVHWVV